MALSRATPSEWVQETGTTSRATPSGWVQESVVSGGTVHNQACSASASAQSGVVKSAAAVKLASASAQTAIAKSIAATKAASMSASALISRLTSKDMAPKLVARPDGTIDGVGFTPVGAPTIHECLNEVTPDDATYIYGVSDAVEVSLQNITDPGISTGHVVRFRAKAVSGWVAVTLMQGAATIASKYYYGTFPTTWTDDSFTLTPAEASAITDYTDLRLSFAGLVGNVYYSWAEFSVDVTPTTIGAASRVNRVNAIKSAVASAAASLATQTISGMVLKTLEAVAVGAASMVRQVNAIKTVAASGAASIIKRVSRTMALAAAGAAALATQTISGIQYKTLNAVASATATIARRASAIKTATATGTASVMRAARKTITTAVSATATAWKTQPRAMAATATEAATMLRTATQSRLLSASAAGMAAMTRLTRAIRSASASSAADVSKQARIALNAANSGFAALSKTRPRLLSAVSTALGVLITSVFTVEQQVRNIVETTALFATEVSRHAAFTVSRAVSAVFSKSIDKDTEF